MTRAEVASNSARFFDGLPTAIAHNMAQIRGHSEQVLSRSYERLTSIQAWRSFVLETALPDYALGFYAEAQNDAIVSMVLASGGLWRSSLKSLRSAIENIIRMIYYKDHPIEYRLWESGDHRPPFESYFKYMVDHPDLKDVPASISGIVELKKRYSRLSDVVHSSSKDLRMTDDLGEIVLWKTDVASISKWDTFVRDTCINVNLLLLCIFKDYLLGASALGLREVVGSVVPASKHRTIKTTLKVTLRPRK